MEPTSARPSKSVAVLRPYYLPYHGFFRVVARADLVVILDCVQFPLGTTWLTRNRFKHHQGVLWLTVPVWKKGLGLQRIREVRICYEGRWVWKHLQSLRSAYAHAPYLEDYFPTLQTVYTSGLELLVEFNLALLREVAAWLGLRTPMVLQSEVGVDAPGTGLLRSLCEEVGATCLLVPSGAEDHIQVGLLEEGGIRVTPVRSRPCVYPQLWGSFEPNLSVVDMLFCCGPKAAALAVGPAAR